MITNELTKTLERQKGIPVAYTFVAGQPLRAIDLLYRTFCTPFADNVVANELTRSDFRRMAEVNHVDYREAPLNADFYLDAEALLKVCDDKTRLVWLCMPNPVTGNNNMVREELARFMDAFDGMTVVDESLSDYARQRPLRYELPKHPRLIVLDKPGLLFAQPAVIGRLQELGDIYDYEGEVTLPDPFDLDRHVRLLMQERTRLMDAFRELSFCEHVYASEADFFVVRMSHTKEVVDYLRQRSISISTLPDPTLLRIPIGTRADNNELVGALRQLMQ